MFTFSIAFMAVASAAPCGSPSTNENVVVTLERAVDAYEQAEIGRFSTAVDEARAATECLGEPLTRTAAAALHRVLGLQGFVSRDIETSEAEFAAARRLEPDFRFPESIVPAGNPVESHYSAMDPDGDTTEVPTAKGGSIRLDGSVSTARNPALPVVFQRLDERGGVVETRVLDAGAPLPEYVVGKPAGPDFPQPKVGPKGVVMVAGIGGLVAAGGLYGAAWAARGGYDRSRQSLDPDGLSRNRSLSQGFTMGAGGAAVVGAGLLTTGLLLEGRF